MYASNKGGEVNSRERCEILAQYLIENRTTVRSVAKKYGISKSTVHKDVTEKLYYVNRGLFKEAKEVLDVNKSERHLRGGEATKNKYSSMKSVAVDPADEK